MDFHQHVPVLPDLGDWYILDRDAVRLFQDDSLHGGREGHNDEFKYAADGRVLDRTSELVKVSFSMLDSD